MKLSICVITMNRANQLKEALESCLACELPQETEFIIIDNASTDDTEKTVYNTLNNKGYNYYYEKLPKNLGVGGGRNYAYDKACGEYVYMLDDDAVIDAEKISNFFIKAVDIMESNPTIVTLTTQIYDTAWQKNRIEKLGSKLSEGLYRCYMFCGGSHFLRKSFFTISPYLPNKYGYEEIPPSLRAINAGKVNVFCPELRIIHKPAVDKWDYNDSKNHELLVKGIALPYAIKKMMYPSLVLPILKLANVMRMNKYLKNISDYRKKVNDVVNVFCDEYPINERIKFSTAFQIVKDFGLSAF